MNIYNIQKNPYHLAGLRSAPDDFNVNKFVLSTAGQTRQRKNITFNTYGVFLCIYFNSYTKYYGNTMFYDIRIWHHSAPQ